MGSLNIKEMLLSINQFSRPCKPIKSVNKIVLHWTGVPKQDNTAVYRYFELLKNQNATDNKEDRYASAHYIIDKDDIIRVIPESEVAYHAGNVLYNNSSIGIEMCPEKSDGEFLYRTIYNTAILCNDICKRYGLNPYSDIIRHYDVTKKECPKYFVTDEKRFEEFKELISLVGA